MDVVIDSVSVATTFKDTLEEKGIIFCSISDAIQNHPELVRKHLGTVVPKKDNYYAALNSAVFSDGSFCYIPKGVIRLRFSCTLIVCPSHTKMLEVGKWALSIILHGSF